LKMSQQLSTVMGYLSSTLGLTTGSATPNEQRWEASRNGPNVSPSATVASAAALSSSSKLSKRLKSTNTRELRFIEWLCELASLFAPMKIWTTDSLLEEANASHSKLLVSPEKLRTFHDTLQATQEKKKQLEFGPGFLKSPRKPLQSSASVKDLSEVKELAVWEGEMMSMVLEDQHRHLCDARTTHEKVGTILRLCGEYRQRELRASELCAALGLDTIRTTKRFESVFLSPSRV
jgi:hypothetical protein